MLSCPLSGHGVAVHGTAQRGLQRGSNSICGAEPTVESEAPLSHGARHSGQVWPAVVVRFPSKEMHRWVHGQRGACSEGHHLCGRPALLALLVAARRSQSPAVSPCIHLMLATFIALALGACKQHCKKRASQRKNGDLQGFTHEGAHFFKADILPTVFQIVLLLPDLSMLSFSVPRWSEHPDVRTLFSVLSYIEKTRPLTGVIENVQGMKSVCAGMELSAYQLVVRELERMGYYTGCMDLDLALWQSCTRRRLQPQCPMPFLHKHGPLLWGGARFRNMLQGHRSRLVCKAQLVAVML